MLLKTAFLIILFSVLSSSVYLSLNFFSSKPKSHSTLPTTSSVPSPNLATPSAELSMPTPKPSFKPSNSLQTSSPSASLHLEKDGCSRSGCSGEICADPETMKGFLTVCGHDDRGWAEIACTKNLMCEKQPNGECGFTTTTESKKCAEKVEKDYPNNNY